MQHLRLPDLLILSIQLSNIRIKTYYKVITSTPSCQAGGTESVEKLLVLIRGHPGN